MANAPYRFDPLQLCLGAQWSQRAPAVDRIEIDSFARGGSCFIRGGPRWGMYQHGWGQAGEVGYMVLGVFPTGAMAANVTSVFFKWPGFLLGGRGAAIGYGWDEVNRWDLPSGVPFGGVEAHTASPVVFAGDSGG